MEKSSQLYTIEDYSSIDSDNVEFEVEGESANNIDSIILKTDQLNINYTIEHEY